MSIKIKRILFLMSLLFLIGVAECGVLNISEGDIQDHADASVSGSIAWFLTTFGSGHTYKLTTSSEHAVYEIKSSITMPVNTVITSDIEPEIQAQIEMKPYQDNTNMIIMADNCELSNLTVNANRNASIAVRAVRCNNVKILNCELKDTRNYFEEGFDGRGYGVHAWYVSGLIVDSCYIHNIACNPKVDELSWEGRSSGIDALEGSEIVVTNNEIDYVLSHGVTFTASVDVTVDDNKIWHTGENARLYVGFQTGDGVGAYHNGLNDQWLNWNIMDNDIQFYGNHGIHVSGRGIRLERNHISDGLHNGISIQDWRDPHDCIQDVWVEDNYIAGHGTGTDASAPLRYPVYVNTNYKPGSIRITGITGNTDVYWGDETCEGVDSCSLLTMDFNNDCRVDLLDLQWFALRWGTCTDPANHDCW